MPIAHDAQRLGQRGEDAGDSTADVPCESRRFRAFPCPCVRKLRAVLNTLQLLASGPWEQPLGAGSEGPGRVEFKGMQAHHVRQPAVGRWVQDPRHHGADKQKAAETRS